VSSEEKILEKITTRNILALSTTAVFLTVVLQMTFNAAALLVLVAENTEWIIGGAIIFGALIAKWSDMIQFFFRRANPK